MNIWYLGKHFKICVHFTALLLGQTVAWKGAVLHGVYTFHKGKI